MFRQRRLLADQRDLDARGIKVTLGPGAQLVA